MNDTEKREDEIDLVDLFFYLVKRAWVLIAALLIGLLIGFFGTKLFITPQYSASTRVYILNRSNSNTIVYSDIQLATQFLKDYQELITGRNVTKIVIQDLGLDMTPAELSRKIEVTAPDGTRILQINVTDEDPQKAAALANKIQEVAATQIKNIMDIDAVRVIYTADVPVAPSSPNTTRNALLCALLCALLATGIFVVVYILDDTIRTEEDVERYLSLPVLGIIPVSSEMALQQKKPYNPKTGSSSRKEV